MYALLISAQPLCAKDRKVKILLYSVTKPSRITAHAPQGNIFLNGAVFPSPVTLEAKGSSVLVKGYGPAKKAIKIDPPGRDLWITGTGIPKRLYRGIIEVTAEKGILKIINTTSLESYIASVVSGEASDLSNDQAFRAQAVAARTYVLRHMNNHMKNGYNLCDSTHCQLFTGFSSVRTSAQAAADFTRSEVVTYNGTLASTFYHSICGGRTEAMVFVWPFEHKPYLISVKDGPSEKPYCAVAPGFSWKTTISLKAMTNIARDSKWINKDENITGMKILDRGTSKRAAILEFSTQKRKSKVAATEFYHDVGRRAGWKAIRSTLFEVYSGKNNIILEGKGYGHGVGMCQWGAEGMGRAGFGYRDILRHYYPGTKITYD